MAPHVTMPQRSTKPLTEPQELTMRTAKRRRVQGEAEVRVSSTCEQATCGLHGQAGARRREPK